MSLLPLFSAPEKKRGKGFSVKNKLFCSLINENNKLNVAFMVLICRKMIVYTKNKFTDTINEELLK